MEAGRDVLIVFDDFTQHAKPIASFPSCSAGHPDAKPSPVTSSTSTRACWNGRRSAQGTRGAVRSTALPIIETEAQNISAYNSRPTSFPSRTGRSTSRRPCLNWASCPRWMSANPSRASAARRNRAAYRAVAGDLKLAYAQFEELEAFARFGRPSG